MDILRMSAARRRHQSVAEVLQRILVRGTQFVLNRASALFQPQPWAVGSDGYLLGHLLTVDDAVFDSVAEECLVEVLTLPEAFEQEWADLEQRSAWVKTYTAALRSLAELEECNDRSIRQRDEVARSTAEIAWSNKPGNGPWF